MEAKTGGERQIYALVRVPKSGSTTLVLMMRDALPGVRLTVMPKLLRSADEPSPLEKLREARARAKRFWRLFRTFSEQTAWERLAASAKDGDIVAGHFPYGAPQLRGFRIDYITLLRDPVARLVSEYNYARVGFAKRWPVQRLLHRNRLAAAAARSFSGYLAFLEEHREVYADLATRYVAGGLPYGHPMDFLAGRYFHYGALERMQVFIDGLSAKLGVPVPARHDRATPGRPDVEISAADRSRIERLFGSDMEMHRALIRHIDRGGS